MYSWPINLPKKETLKKRLNSSISLNSWNTEIPKIKESRERFSKQAIRDLEITSENVWEIAKTFLNSDDISEKKLFAERLMYILNISLNEYISNSDEVKWFDIFTKMLIDTKEDIELTKKVYDLLINILVNIIKKININERYIIQTIPKEYKLIVVLLEWEINTKVLSRLLEDINNSLKYLGIDSDDYASWYDPWNNIH